MWKNKRDKRGESRRNCSLGHLIPYRLHDCIACNDSILYHWHMTAAPATSITIRNLDGQVKERLRMRAARNGRSMEAEARSILAASLTAEGSEAINLAEAIRRRVAPLGGGELDEPPPVAIGDPPAFGR